MSGLALKKATASVGESWDRYEPHRAHCMKDEKGRYAATSGADLKYSAATSHDLTVWLAMESPSLLHKKSSSSLKAAETFSLAASYSWSTTEGSLLSSPSN